MADGIMRTLTNVRHVPKLKKMLTSLSAFDSNGYMYKVACGVMRISQNAT